MHKASTFHARYNTRIIPRLDVKGPNLVKGIHLEGLRVLGDPHEFMKLYCEQGADEIYYVDCVASLYERNNLTELIEDTAKSIFIPITVGGGIRTIFDIERLLRAGADRISINTSAIKRPSFITEAAEIFGSSTIAVAIEAIKSRDGVYYAFTDNGRQETGRNVIEWALEAQERGAGEIILTSVDREGTGLGFDIEFAESLLKRLAIPVVIHGGAGFIDDVVEVIHKLNPAGVCIASCFHYYLLRAGMTTNRPGTSIEGNTIFLSQKRSFGRVEPFGIRELKKKLSRLC